MLKDCGGRELSGFVRQWHESLRQCVRTAIGRTTPPQPNACIHAELVFQFCSDRRKLSQEVFNDAAAKALRFTASLVNFFNLTEMCMNRVRAVRKITFFQTDMHCDDDANRLMALQLFACVRELANRTYEFLERRPRKYTEVRKVYLKTGGFRW